MQRRSSAATPTSSRYDKSVDNSPIAPTVLGKLEIISIGSEQIFFISIEEHRPFAIVLALQLQSRSEVRLSRGSLVGASPG
jgi:hypothetical protein